MLGKHGPYCSPSGQLTRQMRIVGIGDGEIGQDDGIPGDIGHLEGDVHRAQSDRCVVDTEHDGPAGRGRPDLTDAVTCAMGSSLAPVDHDIERGEAEAERDEKVAGGRDGAQWGDRDPTRRDKELVTVTKRPRKSVGPERDLPGGNEPGRLRGGEVVGERPIERKHNRVEEEAETHRRETRPTERVQGGEGDAADRCDEENHDRNCAVEARRDQRTDHPHRTETKTPKCELAQVTKRTPADEPGQQAQGYGESGKSHGAMRLPGGQSTITTLMATTTASGSTPMSEIRAEMAANVWQVPAEVGATVAAGDVLVILESMKMEIPVEAERGGVITEVRVKPTDQVQDGDVLVVLEP